MPVGAFLAKENVAKALVPGDHGTTYGGNPFACAAVSKVFDIFEKENILENVNKTSLYLEEQLDKIVEEFECVEARRGKGFMQGLVLNVPVGEVVAKSIANGLFVISAGQNVLRLVPPLVINEKNIDEMTTILRDVLKTM